MKKAGFLLVFIVSLWLAWPLFRPGYIPTHDGEFSIIRIWQYAKMLQSGYLFPRWSPDLNSGYGVPLFIFYYPLPYLVGTVFHFFGTSLVDAFKLTLAASYVAAGIFCFLWLKKLFNQFAAVVGTLLFLSVPYWFVDIYIRGSAGEALAIMALVGGFACIEYSKKRLLALTVAVLVLSHNIAAAMFLPILAGYILLRRAR